MGEGGDRAKKLRSMCENGKSNPSQLEANLILPVGLWVADAYCWPCCSVVPRKAPGTPTLGEAALGLTEGNR